ncbi:4319_t:CDS:2 [Funneliformis geosporum]|uniref:4319_t:CDS:1 n=1 Tax=Funneliformis geosporum TaxID=1117311 RepID=A0A9W4SRG8_9GLOM|nr:4319_t:CDS:2 [Funneliformis geosporum]
MRIDIFGTNILTWNTGKTQELNKAAATLMAVAVVKIATLAVAALMAAALATTLIAVILASKFGSIFGGGNFNGDKLVEEDAEIEEESETKRSEIDEESEIEKSELEVESEAEEVTTIIKYIEHLFWMVYKCPGYYNREPADIRCFIAFMWLLLYSIGIVIVSRGKYLKIGSSYIMVFENAIYNN